MPTPAWVFWRRKVATALTVLLSASSAASMPADGKRRFVGTLKLGVVCELPRKDAKHGAHRVRARGP